MLKKRVLTIKPDEIQNCVETLVDAFKHSPINRYIFSNEKQIHEFYSVMLQYCIHYGLAIRTEQYEAVALRILPGDSFNHYWRFFRAGILSFFLKLPLRSQYRFLRLTHILSAQRKKIMGSKNHWYCWILGTHSKYQGKGFGSQLMDYTFHLAQSDTLDLYLQTDDPKARLCHQKKGYLVKDKLFVDGLELYFMVKSLKDEVF